MMIRTKKNLAFSTIIIWFVRFCMVLGIIQGVVLLYYGYLLGSILIAVFLLLLILSFAFKNYLVKCIKSDLNSQLEQILKGHRELYAAMDIPIFMLDQMGEVKWANKLFLSIISQEDLIGKNIRVALPQFNISELYRSNTDYEIPLMLHERRYIMRGKKITVNDEETLFCAYLIDDTENALLRKKIEDQRCIVGYFCIDNYEEVMQSIEEVRRPMLAAVIDRRINQWFKEKEVVITKFDKDKYMMFFTKKVLKEMEERKFDLLDELRQIQVGNELPVTVSIGIGKNMTSLLASKEDAKAAFDLAQGRGGDQAIIKNIDKYTFYGGKTKEVEKSTRVKVRIKAYAFKELLNQADKVFIMGHKNIDMDCLGAAMGVYRAAAIVGKKAQIILNEPTFAIQALYHRIMESNEYNDLFITHKEAEEQLTKDTLIVIVDVHRQSYLEYPELITHTKNIVIFDHHRKSTDFIEDAVLTYIETFISSTCEMIAEILNYLTDKVKLTQIEADALLAGITIDTKNFVFKTGVRTFEAAAFLRRNGADSSRVRMLFQNDMEIYKARAAAIKDAEIWPYDLAVSQVDGNLPNANIVAAQVADELLNIKGIQASFVITQMEDELLISARALSDINVQRIMELLGGGGHATVAGAQFKDITVEEAKEKLREAIENYFEEGERK